MFDLPKQLHGVGWPSGEIAGLSKKYQSIEVASRADCFFEPSNHLMPLEGLDKIGCEVSPRECMIDRIKFASPAAAIKIRTMKIRPLATGDVDQVSRLLHSSWLRTYGPIVGAEETISTSRKYHSAHRIAAELKDPLLHAVVAEKDGVICGYALARGGDGETRIVLDRLHVEPAYFGTGLAADLMHAGTAYYPAAQIVELEVLEGNDRALAFYRKHGFETVRMAVASYDATDHRSHIMEKLLAAPQAKLT